MADTKKLTKDIVIEEILRIVSPDKGNGARPDALRTFIERAKIKNRQSLEKRI